jgi:hypothetical protein
MRAAGANRTNPAAPQARSEGSQGQVRAASTPPLDHFQKAHEPRRGDRCAPLCSVGPPGLLFLFLRSRGYALRACPWLPSGRTCGAPHFDRAYGAPYSVPSGRTCGAPHSDRAYGAPHSLPSGRTCGAPAKSYSCVFAVCGLPAFKAVSTADFTLSYELSEMRFPFM